MSGGAPPAPPPCPSDSPGSGAPACRPGESRRAASFRIALQPWILPSEGILAPRLELQPEVLPHQRQQVRRRLPREHALHHVTMARVPLRLLLEDPPARLRAEHV